MLVKLIKHEIKSVYKNLFFVCACILSLMVSIRLLYVLASEYLKFTPLLESFFIIITLSSLIIYPIIFVAKRFHENLLGDQGYLMFTLPVKTYQLILSKIISFIIFVFTISISYLILYSALYNNFKFQILGKPYDYINSIMSLVNLMLLIYLCMSISSLFKNHRVLISIFMYILIQTLVSFQLALFQNIFHVSSNLITIIFYILLSVLQFTAINYILSKKLNLE